MLYMIGPVLIDVFPLNANEVERDTGADYAPKDLVGRLRDREFVGEGDFTLTLKGKLLPNREPFPGGLLLLDVLHGVRLAGMPIFVMRGDFMPMGWFVLETIKEQHEFLSPTGVGMVISHEFKLTKVSQSRGNQFFGGDAGSSLISTIITLFG
jgi:phage protein U